MWRRWHSPSRRNPDPLDLALFVAALAPEQRSRVKAAASLVILRCRLVTWSTAVHPFCVSGGEGRWWLFKAGRRSGDAVAINAKMTCIPPRGLCIEATLHCAAHLATETMRRLTARACDDRARALVKRVLLPFHHLSFATNLLQI